MDSGNSGSMQSSSGGDEEYDSRAESMSAFFNLSGQINSVSNPPQQHQQHQQPPPSSSVSLFDSLSTYLDTFPRSPPPPHLNSLLNLDPMWPRTAAGHPTCTDISAGFIGPSCTSPSPMPSSQLPIPDRHPPAGDHPPGGRNPKKRSRASRRAPTTVLTTDTSNFRAMVQEFTGIPSPPFAASPFSRTRLDLFSAASSIRARLADRPDASLPSYLLRPFPQKMHNSSFPSLAFTSSSLPSSSPMLAAASTSITPASHLNISPLSAAISDSTTNGNNNNNYPISSSSSDLNLGKDHQNLLNMNNPLLTFQSLLHSPPPNKYQLSNLSGFNTKSQGSSSFQDPLVKMGGGLNEFSMRNGSLVSSDGMPSLGINNPTKWAEGGGSDDGVQEHMRGGFNANYENSQQISRCKMNYSASSSSDFHAEKGQENVSSRGEGMVDSWICSSD